MDKNAQSPNKIAFSQHQLEKVGELFHQFQLNFKPLVYQGEYSNDSSGQLDPNQITHSSKWFYVQKLTEDNNVNNNRRKVIYWTSPNFLRGDSKYEKSRMALKNILLTLGYEIYIGKHKPVRVQSVPNLDEHITTLEPMTRQDVINNLDQTNSLATVDRTFILDLATEYQLVRNIALISNTYIEPMVHLLSGVALDELEDFLPAIDTPAFDELELSGSNNLEQIRLLVSRLSYLEQITFDFDCTPKFFELALTVINQATTDRSDVQEKKLLLKLFSNDLTANVIDLIKSNRQLYFRRMDRVKYHEEVFFDDKFHYAESVQIDCDVNSVAVDSNFNAPELRKLSLSNANVEIKNLDRLLGQCPNLDSLSLSKFLVYDPASNLVHLPSSSFDSLKKIKTFSYHNNPQFFGGFFAMLAHMPQLQSLDLSISDATGMSKEFLQKILHLSNLTMLSIFDMGLEHEKNQLLELIDSARCTKLEELAWFCNDHSTFRAKHVLACLKKFPSLKFLRIQSRSLSQKQIKKLQEVVEKAYPDVIFQCYSIKKQTRTEKAANKLKKLVSRKKQKKKTDSKSKTHNDSRAPDQEIDDQPVPTINRDAVIDMLEKITSGFAEKIDVNAMLGGEQQAISGDMFVNNALRYFANMSEQQYQQLLNQINLASVNQQLKSMLEDMLIDNDVDLTDHAIEFIKHLIPEVLLLLRETLLLKNGDVKKVLQKLQQTLTSCNTPKTVQKQIGIVLTKVAKTIQDAVPKLFDHVRVNKPLATQKDWLKILSLPKLIALGFAIKKLLSQFESDPFFQNPIEFKITSDTQSNDTSQGLGIDLDDFDFEKELQDVLQKTAQQQEYDFNTWETLHTAHCQDFKSFWTCLSDALESRQPDTPNALVYMDKKEMQWFNLAVLKQQLAHGRRHCYIDNLERAHLTTLASKNGLMVAANTELGQFLEHAGPGDVLVVNANKHAQDVLGLTDPQGRQFLTKVVPKGVKIIVQVDAQAPPIADESVYARFSVRTDCAVPLPSQVKGVELGVPITTSHEWVDLYHDARAWEVRMVGRFRLQGRAIQFIEQKLLAAINNKKSVFEIINYPENCAEFSIWLNTVATTRQIWINNKRYDLPSDFKIHLNKREYDLKYVHCQFVEFDKMQHTDFDYALNPATFYQFFENHLEKSKKLYQTDGWLRMAQRPLKILVDAKLSRDQWAEIIDQCREHQVNVTFCVLDKAVCPSEYSIKSVKTSLQKDQSLQKQFNQARHARVDVLVSENADETVAQLCQNMHVDGVYDLLHDDHYADLIDYLDCQQFGIDYQVEHKSAYIWEQLQSLPAKTIVLKGPISATLKAKLATLFGNNPRCWVNGKAESLVGRVIFVTDKQHDISYAQNRFVDVQPTLKIKPPMMINVPGNTDINVERMSAVMSIFAHSNGIKVIGEFGVGKSIFARKLFKALVKEQYGIEVEVFIGKEEIDAYGAYDQGDKLLVLDEYNLAPEHTWDTFRGMENPITPGFRANHNFYSTKPTEKNYKSWVMFLANPNNQRYDGRHHHQFVDDMIPGVQFNQFTEKFLVENIVGPILDVAYENLTRPGAIKSYPEQLVACYQKLKELANEDKAISARNLAMLSCRFVCYLDECSPQDALANAVSEEAMYLLEDEAAIDKFFEYLTKKLQLAKPKPVVNTELNIIVAKMEQLGYIVTESRVPILKQLLAMFTMRTKILAKPKLDQFVIRAMLIEGETRVGKTAMVQTLMRAFGMVDCTDPTNNLEKTVASHDQFYTITTSNTKAMKPLVDKGQKTGGVNLIDEINAKPVESELNAPLTGVDQQGKPSTAGHRLIATANPAERYPGRFNLSAAMKNRFMLLNMINLPDKELRYIVNKLGAEDQTDPMVDAYLSALKYGIRHKKYPLPNPALLFETAKQVAQKITANKSVVVEPKVVEQPVKRKPCVELSESDQILQQAQRLVDQLKQKTIDDNVAKSTTEQKDTPQRSEQLFKYKKRRRQKAAQTKNTVFTSQFDGLKVQIVQKILEVSSNQSASFKDMLLHPIRTFRAWRKRRLDRHKLRALKKTWMACRIDELVDHVKDQQPSKHAVNKQAISLQAANKVSTKYILQKFRRVIFPITQKQAVIISDFVREQKPSYNTNLKNTDNLIRKTAKLNLWADIENNVHAQKQQDVMLSALAGAKRELLSAEVAAHRK